MTVSSEFREYVEAQIERLPPSDGIFEAQAQWANELSRPCDTCSRLKKIGAHDENSFNDSVDRHWYSFCESHLRSISLLYLRTCLQFQRHRYVDN